MSISQINVSDVTVEQIDIHSSSGTINLIPYLEELNIYENIFENHLSGHITLQEAYNLPHKLPIVGEETISCRIRLQGDAREDYIISPPRLHVHELSDRFLKTPQSQRFSLDLVSEQYMCNLHSRVTKSYINKSADVIIMDIWEKYLRTSQRPDGGMGGMEGRATKPIDCIIPGWTPYQAFNWLCERAQPSEHGVGATIATNFVFFETMDRSFFVSLDELVSDRPVAVLSQDIRRWDPTQVKAEAGFVFPGAGPWIKIDALTYVNQFQKVKNINKGQYASKLITHDIVKKKILQHDYYFTKDWDELQHTDAFSPISNSATVLRTGEEIRTSYAPDSKEFGGITTGQRLSDFTDSRVEFYPKHDRMYAKNEKDLHDNKVEIWKQRRWAQMASFNGIQMMVRCAGVSGFRVGMVVEMVVPSPESTSSGKDDVAYDKYLSGRYLVTSVRHMFGNEKGSTTYKMLLLLTKDGFKQEVPQKKSGVDFNAENQLGTLG